VAAVVVRSWVDLVRRRDHGRTCSRRVPGNFELSHDVARVWTFRERDRARDARDDRKRAQVHEDVPCLTQDDGLVGTNAACIRNGGCCGDGAL
jgi:hypothetical protein